MNQVVSMKLGAQKRPAPALSNSIFAMMIFVITEVMFFTALISAFLVIKKDRTDWALPENIQLPVAMTALNTGVLFLSGLCLYFSALFFKKQNLKVSRKLLLFSALLGVVFVSVQGFEWLKLLSFGLTMKSSIFGALFFLIIGSHGLHALAGALVLFYCYFFLFQKKDSFNLNAIYTLQIFWFFVVGVWPILYFLVYF